MVLKDGSIPEDSRLGRIYQLDYRSLDYPVTRKLEQVKSYSDYMPRSYSWSVGTTLDQGYDGACVGFSFAHDLIARPGVVTEVDGRRVDDDYAKEKLYWEAQKIDEWGGGAYPGANPFYEGTSVLAGAKVMKREGFYDSYYWALDLKQMAMAVAYAGPAIIGINWYEGMFYPDHEGFIHVYGNIAGGHAVLVYGVKIKYKSWISSLFSRNWENVDKHKSYFKIHNSWGPGWGLGGNCYISFADMKRLLQEQGECCIPSRIYDWS